MEEVHRQTQAEKAVELQNRLARIDGGKKVPDQGGSSQPAPPGIGERPREPPPGAPARNLFMPPGAHPAMIPPRPPILFRPAPPPLRPGMAPSSVRLPPGPPPGRPPAPPGPPPGRPPMGMMAAAVAAAAAAQSSRAAQGGVVSAAPQLLKEGKSTAGQSVIEAKPQMRNLKSDITRFVPTNVKIKRDVGPGAKKRQSGKMDLPSPTLKAIATISFCYRSSRKCVQRTPTTDPAEADDDQGRRVHPVHERDGSTHEIELSVNTCPTNVDFCVFSDRSVVNWQRWLSS